MVYKRRNACYNIRAASHCNTYCRCFGAVRQQQKRLQISGNEQEAGDTVSKEKILRCSARRRETSSPARTSPRSSASPRGGVEGGRRLRRDGYTIEAQTGLGYRLADSPDVLSERELRRRLGETKIASGAHSIALRAWIPRTAISSALPEGARRTRRGGGGRRADWGRGRRGRSFQQPGARRVSLSAAAPAARAGEDTAAHGARRGGGLRCGGAHLRRAAAD